MFRAGSVLWTAALLGVLAPSIACAHVNLSPHTGTISLSRAVFDACFGLSAAASEPVTSDAFALQMSPNAMIAVLPALVASTHLPVIRISDAAYVPHQTLDAATAQPLPSPELRTAYAPVALTSDPATTLSPADQALPVVKYARAPLPAPTASISQYRFDLPSANGQSAFSLSPVLNPTTGFSAGEIGSDANASLPQTQANVSVPVRVGHVRFSTHAVAGQAQSDALALRDRSVGGGATFDARLGKQRLGVDLSSQVEHLQVDQPSFNASSFDSTSNVGLTSDHLPVFVPAYADVTKHSVSAGVAVPVSKRVTAAVQVDSQHLLGGYGAPGLQNLDANNMIYGAKVTYQLKGNAALSLSAKQTQFRDNLLPANAFNQTSANLNLTVKF